MEKIVFFTCAYSPADKVSEGGGLKEEGEDIDVIETTLEEAAAMIGTGEIVTQRRSSRSAFKSSHAGCGSQLSAATSTGYTCMPQAIVRYRNGFPPVTAIVAPDT
jgi:hypothetical protein